METCKQSFRINIKTDNHEYTRSLACSIKQFCKAFGGYIHIYEYKSARKGDVLSRELQLIQEGDYMACITLQKILIAFCMYRGITFEVMEFTKS